MEKRSSRRVHTPETAGSTGANRPEGAALVHAHAAAVLNAADRPADAGHRCGELCCRGADGSLVSLGVPPDHALALVRELIVRASDPGPTIAERDTTGLCVLCRAVLPRLAPSLLCPRCVRDAKADPAMAEWIRRMER